MIVHHCKTADAVSRTPRWGAFAPCVPQIAGAMTTFMLSRACVLHYANTLAQMYARGLLMVRAPAL